MSESTAIAWTDSTFNPWQGCSRVSEGCRFCYAEVQTSRYGLSLWGAAPRRITSTEGWRKPIRWNREAAADGRRHRVFCGSWCDVFEADPTADATRPRLWQLVAETPALDWLLLTKRPERIAECLPDGWGSGWPNVWLGTSIEAADVLHRADALRKVPAVVRFLSCEPLLGPLGGINLAGIDWLIAGGESGPNARPMSSDWARHLRDRCASAGIPYFFKQAGGRGNDKGGHLLDGELLQAFPTPRGAR